MGEGTTRVVEANGAGPRVTALGEEISQIRERLDHLVTELDRRRHARWWTRPSGRQAAGLALVLAVMTATWVFAPRVTRYWPRRSPQG